MRTIKKYEPRDDFDLPKAIDLTRDTAVLIRQSDHKADEDHAFSRESQLKLTEYARRLRNDADTAHVRVYDEGAGVSGQKRIDERVELNRLYNDISTGEVGSLVIMHEDRLFRDEFHTNDTTFVQLLAKYDALLFVRTDNRRYDCTKPSDRNALLEKFIASRNYLDDHVLGRMNGNQQAKALQGLFDGRMLPMGYVTQGKKKQQTLLIYEPWAERVRWLFRRFRELDNLAELCREVEAMPYLFPDPTAEELMRFTFKIRMRKVPGGFKPSAVESIRYMLTNPTYMGAWVYDNAIVIENNHPAIVEPELFIWSYQKLTGLTLQGEPVNDGTRRRLRSDSAQAVLKYILHDPRGPLYVMHAEHPEYTREVVASHHEQAERLTNAVTFSVRAGMVDPIYLRRVKELAMGDIHLRRHIEDSLAEMEAAHAESLVSIEEHLQHVRREREKTLALIHDDILTLTPAEKAKYKEKLDGLRQREDELLQRQRQSVPTVLQSDLDELSDVLADIPAKLDSCSMAEQQKLARLITESAVIEELSVHWLRLTIVWRGPLADRPDVCLIWRQRGSRNDPWTPEEDAIITASYPSERKWTLLEALPKHSWNAIAQRAAILGIRRAAGGNENIPDSIAVDDLSILPDRDVAMELVLEASDPRNREGSQAYGIWLYSAGRDDAAAEIEARNTDTQSSASPTWFTRVTGREEVRWLIACLRQWALAA